MSARKWQRAVLVYTSLTLVITLIGLPFFWMTLTALKPSQEIAIYPPRWLPGTVRWENFAEAWRAAPFGRFYLNSLITTITATFLQVSLGLFMAYAFAFVRFPAKQSIFVLVLVTMMIPAEMKLVPNYLLLKALGWVNTYWALIIPPAAHAFPVFVLYQSFRTFPLELVEAAKVDGAGHLRILLRIILPVSRPLLAAVALFGFVNRWNDYLWPLVVANKVTMRTLPIGLAYLRDLQEGGSQWHLLMAASVMTVLPVLLMFLFAQKQFVAGLTRGAFR